MSGKDTVLRGVAIVLWAVAIFEIFGGIFVWRAPLEGGGTISYNFSLYRQPPPPEGPPTCALAAVARLSFAMPCDFRPPFIDLAKKYF